MVSLESLLLGVVFGVIIEFFDLFKRDMRKGMSLRSSHFAIVVIISVKILTFKLIWEKSSINNLVLIAYQPLQLFTDSTEIE